MIGFRVLASHLIRLMLGVTHDDRILIRAKLMRRIPSSLGMRTFARVLVKRSSDGYVAEPVRTSGSSILSTMIFSNGVVAIPERREGIEAGELVEVELFRPVEGRNRIMSNRKIFRTLISLEEANSKLLEYFDPKPVGEESVAVDHSLGRVLSEDVVSDIDVPGFDRAAMDATPLGQRTPGGQRSLFQYCSRLSLLRSHPRAQLPCVPFQSYR
jgi:molybdopterin biosynthesis enzyme